MIADNYPVTKFPPAGGGPAADLPGKTNDISGDYLTVSCREARSHGNRQRGLVFVCADVHDTSNYSRITIQIGAGDGVGIGAGIDAKRIGGEVQVTAAVTHKLRIVGEIALAARQRCGAAVTDCGASVVVWPGRRGVEIDDGVIDHRAPGGEGGALGKACCGRQGDALL